MLSDVRDEVDGTESVHQRKMERELVTDFEAQVDRLVDGLSKERLATAVKIAAVPQQIRGFGHVKDASVGPAKAEAKRLWSQWEKSGERALATA